MMAALRTYFSEHSVKVEIILILALIAVGRHIIQLDFEHVDGVLLLGIAVLIIGLAAGLAMLRGLHPWRFTSPPAPQTDSAVPQTTEDQIIDKPLREKTQAG
jgi:uncharacterized membrane protein (DUF373 family)